MRVGFVVNPIAGMGGAVGLKGTDGPEFARLALALGAKPVAPARAKAALGEIKKRQLKLDFVTVAGEMGMDELDEAGLDGRVVVTPASRTSAEDTIRGVKAFISLDVELILFAGGDGTAGDVLSVADETVPILGIPAGVKMHSSVFAFTPERAADAVEMFAKTGRVRNGEVMEVDEAGIRQGVVRSRLVGIAKVPDDISSIQLTKDSYHSTLADDEADEIGRYVADMLDRNVNYVLGPGTTTAAVAKHLGLEKTILGVDVVRNGEVVKKDATEDSLSMMVERGSVKIIVSPIGAQGFLFGRGNQQISAYVLDHVGLENFIVIATPTKLRSTPVLRVDTGDPVLDARLRGYVKVIIGHGKRKLVRIE